MSTAPYKAVKAPRRRFTGEDVTILSDIVRETYSRRVAGDATDVPLLDVLQSYDFVLRTHGLAPSEDTFYYRAILKMSVDPTDGDWWAKLDRSRLMNDLKFRAKEHYNHKLLAATLHLWKVFHHVEGESVMSRRRLAGSSRLLASRRSFSRQATTAGAEEAAGPLPGDSSRAHASRLGMPPPVPEVDVDVPLPIYRPGVSSAGGGGAGGGGDSPWLPHRLPDDTMDGTTDMRGHTMGLSELADTTAAAATTTTTTTTAGRAGMPHHHVVLPVPMSPAMTTPTGDAAFPGFEFGPTTRAGDSPAGSTTTTTTALAVPVAPVAFPGDPTPSPGGSPSVATTLFNKRVDMIRDDLGGHTSARFADPASFGNFRLVASTWRQWVAAVNEIKLERERVELTHQQWLQAKEDARLSCLAHMFGLWRAWVWSTQAERVLHYQSGAFHRWKRFVSTNRPAPLTNPRLIRAVFRWIAITLPRHSLVPSSPAQLVPPAIHRLSRLRQYLLTRVRVASRRRPLLEHATAVLDAYTVATVFVSWGGWTRRVRRLRFSRLKSTLQASLDRWEIWTHQERRSQRMAAAAARASSKRCFRRWVGFRHWRRRLSVCATTIASRRRSVVIRAAWRGWKVAQQEEAMLVHLDSVGLDRFARSRKRAAFKEWRRRSTLQRCARRLRRRLALRRARVVLDAWHTVTALMGRKNRLKRAAAAWVRGRVLRRTLSHWRWARWAVACSRALRRKHVLASAVAAWRLGTDVSRACRLRAAAAVAHHTSAVLRRAFRRWLHTSTMQRRLRMARYWHVFSKWQRHVTAQRHADADRVAAFLGVYLRRRLLAWHRVWTCAVAARAMAARLSHVLNTHSLRAALAEWQAAMARLAAVRLFVARRRGLEAGTAWHAWVAFVAHRRSHNAQRAAADAFRRQHTRRSVLLRWAQAYHFVQCDKAIRASANRSCLAAAVRSWRTTAVRRLRRRSTLQSAVAARRRNTLATTWRSWLVATGRFRAERLLRVKRSVWRQWASLWARRRRCAAVCADIRRSAARRRVQTVWGTWRGALHALLRHRAAVAAADRHHRRRLVRRCLRRGLRGYVAAVRRYQSRLNQARAHAGVALCVRVMTAWRQVVLHTHHLQSLASTVARQRCVWCTRTHFQLWCAFVALRRVEAASTAVAAAHARTRLMANAVNAWRQALHDSHQGRRETTVMAVRVMAVWRQVVDSHNARRRQRAAAERWWASAVARGALLRLRQFVSNRRAARSMLSARAARFRRHHTRWVLHQWLAVTVRRRITSAVLYRNRLSNLTTAFSAWHAVIERRRYCLSAVSRARASGFHRRFLAWRDVVIDVHARRQHLASSVNKLAAAFTAFWATRCVLEWRSVTRAAAFHRSTVQQRAMDRWRVPTARSAAVRTFQAGSRLRALRRGMVRWWTAQAVQSLAHRSSLRRSFRRWVATAATQASARAIRFRRHTRLVRSAFAEWARQTAEAQELARAVAQFQLAAASANSGRFRRRVPLGSPSGRKPHRHPVVHPPSPSPSPSSSLSPSPTWVSPPRPLNLDFTGGRHTDRLHSASRSSRTALLRTSRSYHRRDRRRRGGPRRTIAQSAHPGIHPDPLFTHTRATVDVATSRWVYLPAWKAFHSWQLHHAAAVLKRRVSAFARSFAWLQLASRVFSRLNDAVDASRHLAVIDAYHRNVCRRRGFTAWRQYVSYRRSKHQVAMTAAYHYSRRGLVGRIRWWRYHTRYAHWSRRAMASAAGRAADRLSYRALVAWAAVTPLLRRQRRQRAAAEKLYQRTRLRTAFRTIRLFGRRCARSMAVLQARQTRLQTRTVNLAFQCWAVQSRRSAAVSALRRRVLLRVGGSVLRVWRRWRWASAAAVVLHTARSLRRAFGGWQWVVDHSTFLHLRDQSLARLRHQTATRLLSTVFRAWSGVVARRRLAVLHNARRLHTRVKPSCFDAWLAFVTSRRRVKQQWLRAVVHHTTAVLDACLLAWKLFVGRRLQHAAIVEAMTARRDARTLGGIVDVWVTAAARSRRNRRKLRAARAARMRRMLLTVLFRWRGFARSHVTRRLTYKALVSRGLARVMRTALSGWIEYTLSRRFRHSLETVGLTRLCVRTFRRWSTAATAAKHLRQRVAQLRARHRRRFAGTVLAQWQAAARQQAAFTRQLAHQLLVRLHDRVVDRQLNARKVELCRRRRVGRNLAAVFGRLVRWTATELAAKARLVAESFGLWAHKLHARRVIGVMLLRAKRAWRHRAKASALHHLRTLTAIRARRAFAAGVYRRTAGVRALTTFRAQSYRRHRLRRSLGRWRTPVVWRTFRFWVKWTSLRRWMTPVLGRDVAVVKRYLKRWVKATVWLSAAHRPAPMRAFARFRSFRAAKALCRWRSVVSVRSALASVPPTLSGRRASMALAKWRRRTLAQARLRTAGQEVAARHVSRMRGGAWARWVAVRSAMHHLRRRVCGPVFGRWLAWAQARSAKRSKLNASIITVFLGIRRRVFGSWAAHTAAAVAYRAKVRRDAERRVHLGRRLDRLRLAWLRAGLFRWRRTAHVLATMQRVAFRFVLKSAGMSAWCVWKDKTRRRRAVATLTRRAAVRARIALRKSSFARFVAGVKASARHRHAKAIAAQFRDQVALRIVLRSWWRFTARQTALRGLTGTVCRHLARRAIAVWRRAARLATATEAFVEGREWDLVKRALDEWVDRVNEWKDKADDVAEADLHWRVRCAGEAVRRWRSWCVASVHTRRSQDVADAHAATLLTGRYIARWQRFTVMSHQTSVSNEYARRRVLTIGLGRWLDAWKWRRARAHRHETVRYHIQLALILWRRRVTAARLARRHFLGVMLRRLRSRVVRRQSHRVRDAVLAEAHHRRATLRRVIARWARRSQLGTRVRSYVRDGTARLAAKRRLRVLKDRFDQWENRACRFRRLRAVAKVQPKLLLHKIVRRWGASTRVTATDRVQWDRAVTFFNQRVMALSFAAWKGLLFSEVQRRVHRARQRVTMTASRQRSFVSDPDWPSPVSPQHSDTMTGSFLTSPAWSSTTPGTGRSRGSRVSSAVMRGMGGGGGGVDAGSEQQVHHSSYVASSALWTATKPLMQPDPRVAPSPPPSSYVTPAKSTAAVTSALASKYSSYVSSEPPHVPVSVPTTAPLSTSEFLRSSARAHVVFDEEGVARLDMTAPY